MDRTPHQGKQMIAQTQTSVNVLSQTPTNYSSLKREWRSLAYQLAKQHNLKNNAKAILLEMVNSTDRNGEGLYGREHLAEKTNTSVSTVGRVYNLFRKLKIIQSIERRGWNQNVPAKDRTNITVLLFTKHKLPAVEVKMTYDINNTKLQDHKNNITYEEYVCIFDNLDNKTPKPKPKPKPETHIDPVKLKTDPQTEVKRAVRAHGIDETLGADIFEAFTQTRNMREPAAVLAAMLKHAKETGETWKVKTKSNNLDDGREAAIRQWERTQAMLREM